MEWIRLGVEVVGFLDRSTIFLEMDIENDKPPIAYKLKALLLEGEVYKNLIKNEHKGYYPTYRDNFSFSSFMDSNILERQLWIGLLLRGKKLEIK